MPLPLVLFRRDDGIANRMVPSLTALLFAMATVVPLHLPGFAVVTPAFALMAIYHWTIYRPDLLSLVAVFGVGLVLDLLNGAPVGVSPLVLLTARTLVLGQRKLFVDCAFPFLWAGFMMVAALAEALEWLLVSLFYGMPLEPRPFIFQAALTVACFPVASHLLVRAHRAVLNRV